jgi:hypothetical protein
MKKKALPTPKERCIARLYSLGKSSAKRRGIVFDLERVDHARIVQDNCAYCGAKPSNVLSYAGIEFAYSGLDRIMSKEPYSIGNCLPCCSFCNSLKGAMSGAAWLDFIDAVAVAHGGEAPFGRPPTSLARASTSQWRGR